MVPKGERRLCGAATSADNTWVPACPCFLEVHRRLRRASYLLLPLTVGTCLCEVFSAFLLAIKLTTAVTSDPP